MDTCRKLHEDPAVTALLWCLLYSGELNKASLKECGMSDVEAHAIMQDQPGLLRRMRIRVSLAKRLTVRDLAALLRNRLAEHIESCTRASELASLLRCLRGLPTWLFPEWEQQEVKRQLEGKLKVTDNTAAEARPA